MDATAEMKASIKELKKAQAEKTKRVKEAISESARNRYTQKATQRRPE